MSGIDAETKLAVALAERDAHIVEIAELRRKLERETGRSDAIERGLWKYMSKVDEAIKALEQARQRVPLR